MKRAILPAAAFALVALAAAGCSPPVERSEFLNSGLSAKVAFDPSAAPASPANPPPHIRPPAGSGAMPAASANGATTPAKG